LLHRTIGNKTVGTLVEVNLNLIESGNVNALNEIFDLLDGFHQPVDGNLVVFDNSGDLQFHDAVSQWHQFGCKLENKRE